MCARTHTHTHSSLHNLYPELHNHICNSLLNIFHGHLQATSMSVCLKLSSYSYYSLQSFLLNNTSQFNYNAFSIPRDKNLQNTFDSPTSLSLISYFGPINRSINISFKNLTRISLPLIAHTTATLSHYQHPSLVFLQLPPKVLPASSSASF